MSVSLRPRPAKPINGKAPFGFNVMETDPAKALQQVVARLVEEEGADATIVRLVEVAQSLCPFDKVT